MRYCRSVAFRSLSWLTLLSVYYSSILVLLPTHVYAVEDEQQSSETTDPGAEALSSEPNPYVESESRIAEKVSAFKLAQERTGDGTSNPSATQILNEARGASESGNHVGAALLAYEITEQYSGSREAMLALEMLADYSLRMQRGEFPQAMLDMFEAGLPSFNAAPTLESRYVLLGFWAGAAKFADSNDDAARFQGYSVKAMEHAWAFIEAYPQSAYQMGAVAYLVAVAFIMRHEDGMTTCESLATRASDGSASMFTLASHAVLAKVAQVERDSIAQSVNFREFLREWDELGVQSLLTSGIVPAEIKSDLLMYLGLAHAHSKNLEDAVAAFDASANSTTYTGFSAQASALYAVRLRDQIYPEDIDGTFARYNALVQRFPTGLVADTALGEVASLHLRIGDADAAYEMYQHIASRSPESAAAKVAEANLQVLVERELAVVTAGSEEAMNLAMACGPFALQELLAGYGVESSVPELIRLAKTDASGTTMSNLRSAAQHKGVELAGMRVGALEELSAPFIAYVHGNHFVLVTGFDAEGVQIVDMGASPEVWSRATFAAAWSGEVLTRQAADRVATLLTEDSLDAISGGCVDCDEDPEHPLCDLGTVGGPAPPCPPEGEPAGGAMGCDTGNCAGTPHGTSPGPEATPKLTDPWLIGPGLPASGLHQSGEYLQVGVPNHVGSVYVHPFHAEMRIDRTDLVVKSRGTLEFRLTQSYANPLGGIERWLSHCAFMTTSGCQEWCLTSDGNRPAWRSDFDYVLSHEAPEIVSIQQVWAPLNPRQYFNTSEDGDWEIFTPELDFDGSEIWHHTTAHYFLLKRADGYELRFDAAGRLEWVEDASNNRLTYSRDGLGQVTQVALPSGDDRVVMFSYSGGNQTIELKLGSTVLRKVEYINGTDSGRSYTAVEYDDKEAVRYYYGATEGPPACSTTGPLATHYQFHWIDEIRDAEGNSYYFDFDDFAESPGQYGPQTIEVTLPNGLVTTVARTLESGSANSKYALVTNSPAGRTYEYSRNSLIQERRFYNFNVSPGDWETWKYTHTNGLLTQVEAPADSSGTIVFARYTYDDEDGEMPPRLKTVKRGSGTTPATMTWEYDEGYLYPTKMIDPTGVETTYEYDDPARKTRLTAVKPPTAIGTDGYVFAYNSVGEVETVTDPLSKVWTYDHDEFGNIDYVENPLDEVIELEWNSLGQLETVYDPMDKRTEFDYFSSGCGACGPTGQLKEVRRYYTVSSTEYHRLSEFEYDDNGSLLFVTDPAGNIVGYTYDDMNQLETITYPYGETEAKTTELTWRPYGRVATVMDAESTVNEFFYDHVYRLSGIDDPIAAERTYLRYTRFGNLRTVEDPNENVWTYAYNNRHWLTDVTDPLNKNLHYALDDAGRVTEVSAGTGAGNGGTYPIAYDYDSGTGGSHKGTLSRVDYGASSAGGYSVFGYDARGELTSLDDPLRDYFSIDPLVYGYDDAGRLTSITDDAQVLSYVYNDAGAVDEMTDWDGNVTHYGYNDLHELTNLTFLYGTGNAKSWSFAYNALGQPDFIDHPNGMDTDYVYDAFGVLEDILHKSGSTVKQGFSYDEYDDVYNIKKVTHEDGSYWTYGYDDRYRLTSAARHNASDTIRANYSYGYDDGDNMTSKTDPWVDDFSDGDTGDGWTLAGAVWSVSGKKAVATPSGGHATMYVSTTDGNNEVEFDYALHNTSNGGYGINVEPRYNSSTSALQVRFLPGKIDAIENNGGTWVVLAQNTSATSQQNAMYRARVELDGTALKVYRRPASGGVETLELSATVNVTGTALVRFWGLNGGNYTVDNVRILAESLSRSTTMTPRDNNEIAMAVDYNGTNNFTHDAWGRAATESKNSVTKTYSWTWANMLAGIDSSDSSETDVGYAYNGALQRIWRTENSAIKNTYKWDAGSTVLSEATWSGGSPVGEKAFVPGLAEVDMWSTPSYAYLTHDHLGSTRGMWDDSIGNVGTWEFTPYGAPFHLNGPASVTQLYTGHDHDPVTGQYYAPFRYLDPAIGRWVSQDPIGIGGGSNLFGYVGGNPTYWIDPLGLAPGDPYPSMDMAGIRAIRYNNHISIRTGYEYAGWIYRMPNGMYSYTRSETDHSHYRVTVPEFYAPLGEAVATFHTHGCDDPDDPLRQPGSGESFSTGDRTNSWRRGLPDYLGTPMGQIRRFTPVQSVNFSGLLPILIPGYGSVETLGYGAGSWDAQPDANFWN